MARAPSPARAVRVLVVDDSPLLRRALRAVLEPAGLVVVGECGSGEDALARVAELEPDVITMDLDMPGLDGLATIERIMAERPTPILVVTGEPRYRGLDAHFAALTRGAIELVPRPSNDAEATRLVELVRTAATIPVVPHVRGAARHRDRAARPTTPLRPATRGVVPAPPAIVAIGASTGGPGALRTLLDLLGPRHPTPIVIAQHMADSFAEGFVRWLASQLPMPVVEATPRTRLRAGTAYVAVRGPHVAVAAEGAIVASPGPPTPHRPAIDVLFASCAHQFGPRAIGVLLTGMGSDGAIGLGAIAAAGGATIAQDEATCAVFGMPRAAIERGAAHHVLPIDGIARVLRDACRRPHP